MFSLGLPFPNQRSRSYINLVPDKKSRPKYDRCPRPRWALGQCRYCERVAVRTYQRGSFHLQGIRTSGFVRSRNLWNWSARFLCEEIELFLPFFKFSSALLVSVALLQGGR
ncbi:hypothetical protein R3I94_018080 [Phoxinus phoxinus]